MRYLKVTRHHLASSDVGVLAIYNEQVAINNANLHYTEGIKSVSIGSVNRQITIKSHHNGGKSEDSGL